MEHLEEFENELFDENSLENAVSWWESKRLYFNIVVGIAGLVSIIFWFKGLSFFDIIGIILWGGLANVLYSTGFLLEALNRYYFKTRFSLKPFRWLFFVGGTISYALVTFGYGVWYASVAFDPF